METVQSTVKKRFGVDLEPEVKIIEKKIMQIFIVTGLSGAGKSRAADILEDLGYYCVDNLPVALFPKFVEFCISMSVNMRESPS